MLELNVTDPDFSTQLARFCEEAETSEQVVKDVARVLADIKKNGDAAVIKYTKKFDRATLTSEALRVPEETIKESTRRIKADQRKEVKKAIHCIEEFHREGIPENWKGRNPHGATVGENFYPIQRVGLYVPGGNVPLVSTVIMTATLARLAKVPEVAVFTPPRPDGTVDSGLLAALYFSGIKEVYSIGGIQAIGAMAYGTETINPVDKVFGPGNGYVMEAKRQVFGRVGVDLLPGPSEVMIIADHGAQPDFIAADLLAQAEHGSGKEKLYLAITSPELLAAVNGEIDLQISSLTHRDAIRKVLAENFLVIHVDTLEQAAEAANYIAPEHLELQVDKRRIAGLVKSITTAGALLLGHHSPTVLGDFTAGPSHTLPTGRTGRYFSGLQITDFFRRSSIVQYGPRSLSAARGIVETFAELEQLDAHGRSLKVRFE